VTFTAVSLKSNVAVVCGLVTVLRRHQHSKPVMTTTQQGHYVG